MLIETIEISKKYKNHFALKNVSIKVQKHSIHGLLGPNGAGKTTLIRAMTGIISIDHGKIFFDGKDFSTIKRNQIGYLPEERGLYMDMSVEESLLYFAKLKGISHSKAKGQSDTWLEKFNLTERRGAKIRDLSKGMQQKVQFISAVIHNPQLLILDEPFSGFDPINSDLLKREILNLKEEGKTIILSTHNMFSVEEICEQITLMNQGEIILQGDLEEIKKRFQKNLYKIRTYTLLDSGLGNNPLFQTLSCEKKKNEFLYLIQKQDNKINTNEFIKKLIPYFEINAIEEYVPSVNDIFLQTIRNISSQKIRDKI